MTDASRWRHVATVLRDLAESRALDLELLAGAGGVDRRITNPHPQKTGLALSGFDAYLRDGRVLVFGESEVRYLETLDRRRARRRPAAGLQPRAALPRSSPAASTRRRKSLAEADRAGVPLLRTRARDAGRRWRGCRPCSTRTWRRAASSTAC